MSFTVPSIRVVKSMPFKGGTRHFSNRYGLTGGAPSDDTHWHTLMDAIVTAEKAIYAPTVTIVECLGYAAGSDVAVSTKNYTTVGTLTFGGSSGYAPGEAAALIRWSTAARSTKNHPIYLYKYYHHVGVGLASGNSDTLDANEKSAMQTYAAAWITGFSDGTATHKLTSPAGHDATGSIVEEYVTHRDFPYTTSV